MKIAIVCDVLGEENNGTTVAAMNLIRFLKGRGHEVRVVCPDEERRGQPGFYVVPQLNAGPLNNYVRKVGVSIALADSDVLSQALHDADAVHIMTPFFLGKAAVDYARENRIPVTAGFHCQAENITSHLHLMNSQPVNQFTYKAMYRLVYQYVDAIHYPTQFIREVFEAEVGETNGYVISNGVNSRFVRTETERPEEWAGKFVILFTGRYGYEKSHKTLIDAAALSAHEKEIQLVFAGDGPLREELVAYGRKLSNAPVMRFFSREEMLKVINSADLYVHPAEVEIEAIACLEAISCGLVPVIADSPRSATRFFALNDSNLFHFNDVKDLAAKIDYWIEHPEEKAQCSRQYLGYTRQFEQERCMREMEKMIRETAERVHLEHMDSVSRDLQNKPYWLVDILPEQVPLHSPGQYFAVEEYYLQPSRMDGIRRRFADVLLKLNCYYDFRVRRTGAEQYTINPAPETLVSRICEKQEDLCVILPGEDAMITLNHDDTYMTVYHPSESMLRRLRALAAAAGLFLRQPEPVRAGKGDASLTPPVLSDRNESVDRKQ